MTIGIEATDLREPSLSADELHERLEALVFMVLSVRRSVRGAAEGLARFERPAQERFLKSVAFITKSSMELAYNFCMFALPALELMEEDEWREWVLHLMDAYDAGGVLQCIVTMQKAEAYVEARRKSHKGVPLVEVSGMLERFVCGLGGRSLTLAAGPSTYTDTETIYLPAIASRLGDAEQDFRLYKAMVVHLWAQTWFGTWRESLSGFVARFPDPARAVCLFHALETIRLDAYISRELPGVFREMSWLREATGNKGLPPRWETVAARLRQPCASVLESYELLPRVYEEGDIPEPACYQGELFPERTEQTIAARKQREKLVLQQALALVAEEYALAASRRGSAATGSDGLFTAVELPAPDQPDGFRIELRLQGKPIKPSNDVAQLMDSIIQDLGSIPSDYLVPAGHGAYRASGARAMAEGGERVRAEGTHVYDEWDYVRNQYRKGWCLIREKDVHPMWDDFVAQTLRKHRGLLKHLYRTFEALRGEDRRHKREPFGDELDLDAVVQAYADRRVGLEGSERLFTKKKRDERNIAVMFMVDMSGSTKGWINDIEREALVLLCESLELLDDRYAIYGFSGFTHTRCELSRVKCFDEPYSDEVRARISGIRPQDYTRMGAAIRHLTKLLQGVEARTKLLVTLSDGRPDDQDGYHGTYGVEDTRQALKEAKHQGVHPFCITIDDEALDYLPHMYGPVDFTLVSQVSKLPYKISEIYRRITM